MAISIMNNSTALGAMGNLNKANTGLSKTIAQLSSGFRINSAADDASGLAVSEKLRGQISGLSKAASNAQDGISMLQTAEGAMGSVTSIVQRMRELAVQAGDPAYTTNDRAMLQLEVGQLKEEINRISATTEFNTKKLLNGDAAAIWSSSSTDVEAIVRGAPAEGNYEITSLLNNGTNNVYKTNVMNLSEKIGYGKLDGTRANGINEVINVKGLREGTSFTVAEGGGAVAVTTDLVTLAFGETTSALWGDAANSGALATGITAALAAAGITNPMMVKMEATSDLVFDSKGSDAPKDMDNALTLTLTDMVTGKEYKSKPITLAVAGAASAGATGHGAVTIKGAITVNFGDGSGDQTLLVAGAAFAAKNTTGATSYAAKGDFTGSLYQSGFAAVNATTEPNAAIYTVTYNNGNDTGADLTYSVKVMDAFNEDETVKTKLNLLSYDFKTGEAKKGEMTLVHSKATAFTAGTNNYEMKMTSVANSQTQLKDIARFTNSDGRNVLANTQTLTIYGGNGKEAVITLEGSDTIEDLEKKLTSALVDQLGMGADGSTPEGKIVNENLVNFVSQPGSVSSKEAVDGTFVIQGALLGKDSSLSFVGDQGIIDAFGLTNIQKAEDPSVKITVKDAHTGKAIGEDTVTDSVLRGVIDGIDLKINAASKESVKVTYDEATKTMSFKASDTPQSSFLHVKNNATVAAIGPNEGQILDISIGEISTKSLEIDDVNVVTLENAQTSITKLDQALEKISASRAKVGSQMNRLDYTINNLNNARENLTASESRIRDLDIAQASSDLASRQVLMQSATAMLAQANQLPSYAAQLLR